MSSDDVTSTEEYLKNTHDAYRLFYTILLTIGLSQGFGSILGAYKAAQSGQLIGFVYPGVIFLLYLLVVLRFFIGGVRHLDMTYLEVPFDEVRNSNVGRQRFRAADIGMLLFNAGLIILLGGMITQPGTFFSLFAILLLVDGSWGIYVSYKSDNLKIGREMPMQSRWGVNNLAHFVIIVLAFAANWTAVLPLLGFSNSLIDLKSTFDFYFPKL